MNRKTLKVDIKRILFLIEDSTRNDYDSEKLMKFLAKSLDNKLSNDEIENYTSWYLTEAAEDMGFLKNHAEVAKEILEEFREIYLLKKN